MAKAAQIAKKSTISDVAKLANVGKTSVSRYLNSEFDALSDSIKERIEAAIKKLDYRPNQMARSLKRGGSKLIAYIIPDITNPYSVEVMQGLEQACQDNGYTLLVCNTNKDSNREDYYLQLLISYNVEGLLFHSVDNSPNIFHNSPFPIVLVDRKISHFKADSVGLDNIQSSAMATQYLIDQGYDAILFITEPINNVSTRLERVNTFKEIIANHKNRIGRIALLNAQSSEQAWNETLDQCIIEFYQSYPTLRKAIISINGSVTLQISLAAKRLNLVIGKDIGLLGFDDPKWAEVIAEGITSIRQPTYQIGYSAFELLLNRIKGSQNHFQQLTYPGQLIIRGSTSDH